LFLVKTKAVRNRQTLLKSDKIQTILFSGVLFSSSDESSQSPPRRQIPASRAISPDYDFESEPEEEHLNVTNEDSHSGDSIDFDVDDSQSLVVEEETDEDEHHTMPRTRRSARLSEASSLNSTASSNSAGPSTRANRQQFYDSSDTEEYDVSQPINASPQHEEHNVSLVIEINDTQIMGSPPAAAVADVTEDDDDVILIPENIETIDLCTQMFPTPQAFRVPMGVGEVIEIEDSPMTQQQQLPPPRSPRSGPTRNNRGRENVRTVAAPYVLPTSAKASSAYAKRLNLDDSMDDGPTQSVKISCPICLESIIGRQPVSTICGHLFCKQCIKAALQTAKKCPMCKKTLKATNIHDIYLGV
jgi:Ring finger domain